VPAIIFDPVALLRSVRQIVLEHRFDNPDKAVTGRPILVWPGEKAEVRVIILQLVKKIYFVLN